jgi:outer membrane immunogenic protein
MSDLLGESMKHRSNRLPVAAHLLLVLGVLTMMTGTEPLRAADLPAAPAVPIATAVHRWTACHVGVNAGWIAGAGRITTRPGPGGSLGPIGGLPPGDAALLTNTYSSNRAAGFTGGGQAGCDWQAAGSPFVIGVELDGNGSTLREATTAAYAAVTLPATATDIPSRTETVTQRLDWYATVRGRLGLAWDRWLGYVTGGLAVGNIQSSLEIPIAPFFGTASQTRYGWTAGAGIEYSLAQQWTVKLEYLYLDFGTFSYAVQHALTDQRFWSVDVSAREHVLRAGVNYRF